MCGCLCRCHGLTLIFFVLGGCWRTASMQGTIWTMVSSWNNQLGLWLCKALFSRSLHQDNICPQLDWTDFTFIRDSTQGVAKSEGQMDHYKMLAGERNC